VDCSRTLERDSHTTTSWINPTSLILQVNLGLAPSYQHSTTSTYLMCHPCVRRLFKVPPSPLQAAQAETFHALQVLFQVASHHSGTRCFTCGMIPWLSQPPPAGPSSDPSTLHGTHATPQDRPQFSMTCTLSSAALWLWTPSFILRHSPLDRTVQTAIT